jgi:hypothetical protein
MGHLVKPIQIEELVTIIECAVNRPPKGSGTGSSPVSDSCDSKDPTEWRPSAILLEATCDNDELIVELTSCFRADTAARLAAMSAAIESADPSTLRKEAHSIKGGARPDWRRRTGGDVPGNRVDLRENAGVGTGAMVNRQAEQFHEVDGQMARYRSRVTKGLPSVL